MIKMAGQGVDLKTYMPCLARVLGERRMS